LENTTTSASGGEARILKEWNTSAGRWDLRYLEAGDGIEITEEADRILVAATGGGHPWKCSPGGSDTVNVAAGFTLGTVSQDSPGLETLPSYALLKPLNQYNGGTVTVTGTGYIVGYSAFSYGPIVYQTEALTSVDAETVPINTGRISVGSGVTVEFSADFPDGTSSGNYYFVIAKVSLAAGVAVVDFQYLHHNPTLDIYVADGT
jgi:hypothetical protein